MSVGAEKLSLAGQEGMHPALKHHLDKEIAERGKTATAIRRAAKVMDRFLEYQRFDHDGLLRGVPGISMGIVAEGVDPVFINCGYADKATSTPMNEHSVMPIASVSKNFTSTLLRVLQNDGFNPHKRFDTYCDWYKTIDPEMQSITVYELISQTSGMPRDGSVVFGPTAQHPNEEDLIKVVNDSIIVEDYRGGPKYSNLGTSLIGLAVSSFTGRPFNEVLQERLFNHLGMTETYPDIPSRPIPNLATGYTRAKEGGDAIPYPRANAQSPAFGALSTVSDMCRYMPIHFAGNTEILSDRVKEIDQRIRNVDNKGEAYGAGWQLIGFNNDSIHSEYVGHGGNLHGSSAFFAIHREKKIGIVTLANVMSADVSPLTMQMFALIKEFKEYSRSYEKTEKTDSFEQYSGLYRAAYGELEFLDIDGNLTSSYFPQRSLTFDPFANRTRYIPSGIPDEFKISNSGYDVIGETLRFKRNRSGEVIGYTLGQHGAIQGEKVTLQKVP